MSYQQLPVYPPETGPPIGPPYPLRSPKRRPWGDWIRYAFGGIVIFAAAHYLYSLLFPQSRLSHPFQHILDNGPEYETAAAATHDVLDQIDPSSRLPGTFFRDAYPIRSAMAFWDLAEREVAARALDTCDGKLSKELVEAYHETQMTYCSPDNVFELASLNTSHTPITSPPTYISCTAVHRNPFTSWWPYPAAPCISSNIRFRQGDQRSFLGVCDVTGDGRSLNAEMLGENFVGVDVEVVPASEAVCRERIDHTVMVIKRQDQWNPFHVAEDLITTLVTLFIAARNAPELINTRLQLVFADDFGMDGNHFTPLWDRMGAWAPRRLSLDPMGEGVCLTNTIHGVGAGASLLSAPPIGRSFGCTSTITWAASHYYRHLFGLLPLGEPVTPRPINVLWLSRSKLDAYAKSHNDWSNWRDMRHIKNENELLDRFVRGMRDMCDGTLCAFEDAQDYPEYWTLEETPKGSPVPVRFAKLDPTVHALETQIHYVGHATILVSSHGGALGLSLFLPPGRATLVELQVAGVTGNYHFQHMAAQMGHGYQQMEISQTVNVDYTWQVVERHIRERL